MGVETSGPLSGVKIIDLTTMISGPMATAILADQGAEVIKVEPPHGDQLRFMGPLHNGVAACFFACNRNKKSVCLDLKTPTDQSTLKSLIADADVFVQNFRPGAIERMGFGEDVVRAINPDILYVSISGFGEEGPYANQRVYDPVVQALAGVTDVQADKQSKRPKMVQFVMADKVTALTTAQAISAALYQRERTATAQHIKISMIGATISFHWPEAMIGLTFKEAEFNPSLVGSAVDQVFETKDGKYLTCSAITNSEWAGICRALNKPDWIKDERFSSIPARVKNGDERKRLTGEQVRLFDRDVLLDRFAKEDAPAAPLLTRMELLSHEQITSNCIIETHEFDAFGEVRQAAPPARFERTPARIAGPAPALGAHTQEIIEALNQ